MHKYTDADGNLIVAISSSIPGLTFLPPGKMLTDAIPLTPDEIEPMTGMEQTPNKPTMTIEQLTDQLAALQAEIEKLKANQ